MIALHAESGRLVSGLLNTSHPIQTGKATFSSVSPGGDYGWHNAKEIMLVITLAGEIQVEVSNSNSVRTFGPGDIVLVHENPVGAGHRTKVVSKTPWKSIMIRLDENTVSNLLRSAEEITAANATF
jgi:quercetin dioxygenase-like cupin family protein